jgi:alkylation response protein AidB-like acyl-CoA dehydrogenase
MYINYTPEQAALRDELRAYFDDLMTPELKAELVGAGTEGGGPEYRCALGKLGRDGWLGIGWPKKFGGQGRTALEQYIFTEEVQRADFPLPFLTLESVAPTLMQHGTEEQKQFFLPKVLKGEMHFAIGYSEPSSGTDLASLTTRAVRDGDGWLINGQKTFTTLAHYADYIWLAARTDPDAKKHAGISMFMVPTSAPGYKCSPIWTSAGIRTNATFYDDIRVPADALIGGENNGWALITGQLNRERLSLVNYGPIATHLAETVRWAREKKLPDGRSLIDLPWVQANLARVKTGAETLKLLCWKQAWELNSEALTMADASAVKVYGSEFLVEAYRLLLEVVGQAGYLKRGSPEAVLQGMLEWRYRIASIVTFGGGTNEVQRDIISAAGLLMPRGR